MGTEESIPGVERPEHKADQSFQVAQRSGATLTRTSPPCPLGVQMTPLPLRYIKAPRLIAPIQATTFAMLRECLAVVWQNTVLNNSELLVS